MPPNPPIENVPKRVRADDSSAMPADILAEVRRLGLRTPSEAAALIRAHRDGGHAPGAEPKP
jgi:hypothetical protein